MREKSLKDIDWSNDVTMRKQRHMEQVMTGERIDLEQKRRGENTAEAH